MLFEQSQCSWVRSSPKALAFRSERTLACYWNEVDFNLLRKLLLHRRERALLERKVVLVDFEVLKCRTEHVAINPSALQSLELPRDLSRK